MGSSRPEFWRLDARWRGGGKREGDVEGDVPKLPIPSPGPRFSFSGVEPEGGVLNH